MCILEQLTLELGRNLVSFETRQTSHPYFPFEFPQLRRLLRENKHISQNPRSLQCNSPRQNGRRLGLTETHSSVYKSALCPEIRELSSTILRSLININSSQKRIAE
jgi:hypothetical protein